MSDLRVLLMTTGVTPAIGGPFQSVSGLARGLAKDPAADVTVVACAAHIEGWERQRPAWGASRPVVFGGSFPARLAAARGYVVDRLRRGDVDVIHASGLWDETTILVLAAQKYARVPVVWSIRGMLEPWAVKHHAFRKRLAWMAGQRRALGGAAVIHATAGMEAQACRQAGLRQPIAVIPNGLELSPLPKATSDLAAQPRRRCVYLGRLHPKKGLANLIWAWAECDTGGWELEIAGPEERGHAAFLESIIVRLRLPNVRVTGARYGDERVRFLEGCDLFVCPSFSENFGNAIAEAMERGKSVITTTGTPWAVLARERLGWWVKPTVEGLARALREALRLPSGELQRMGAGCRRHVEASFGWPTVIQRVRDVYRWLGGGPRPDCLFIPGEMPEVRE